MAHCHPSEVLKGIYMVKFPKIDSIFGHMGIWAYGHIQKNMAKWGIPEKRIKNAAQRCYSEVPRTLQSKVMAKSRFWGI